MKKATILLFLFLNLSGFSQQKDRFYKIDSLLTFLNQNNKFMGQVCIRETNNIVFEKTYGFTEDLENTKANNRTKYKIGSITKTFTAVMIMQLIEEKKLKLETKLNKFYPEIQNSEKITIHDLLHHRTGIIDYLNADTTSNPTIKISKNEMLVKIKDYKSLFEPNSKFEYSNSNYYLLGLILESITKKGYDINLKERIINKIQLKNTTLSEKVNPNSNESYSYTFLDNKWTLFPEWDMSYAFAAGDIFSTTSDLTLFFHELFSGSLLKKQYVDEMIKLEQSYGKGLVTFPFGERKFFGHTGEIEGFRSVIGYYPADKMGVSLIVNGDNFNRNDIMIGILSCYYKMPYQFPNIVSLKINEQILNKYTGIYSSTQLPIKITIKTVDGQLNAQATGQSAFSLNAINEKEFVFDPANIKLQFEEKNMTLKQGGQEFIFNKE